MRYFLQTHKTWVLFYAQFVKLINLVADAAFFSSLLLRPTTLHAQFSQTLFESFWG